MKSAIRGIDGAVLIHSANPEKLATVWNREGESFRVINGEVAEQGRDIKEGDELSESDGLTLNIFSRVFNDIKNKDPAVQEEARDAKLRTAEIRRRQDRMSDIPEVSADFDLAIQELADWAENFEEFKAALAPDMMDISDRNLTRLGRATMALEPDEYEQASGDVTIYRAMPVGEDIEAGDWVSFNEEYASFHESNVNEGDGANTVAVEVDGKDVWWYGADQNEWVYIPEGTWGNIESIEDLWQSLTDGEKPDSYPEIEGQKLYQSGKGTLQSEDKDIGYKHEEEILKSRLEQWQSEVNFDAEGSIGIVGLESSKSSNYSENPRPDSSFLTEIVEQEEQKAEAVKLIARAKEDGFFLDDSNEMLLAAHLEGNEVAEASQGEEHDVYIVGGEGNQVVIRNTANGQYGPNTDTSPSHYLQRLEENNQVIPDLQIRVIAVYEDADGHAVIWTVQRFVEGQEFKSEEDLEVAMAAKGWVADSVIAQEAPIPLSSISYRYHHAETGIIIQDAHIGNVLFIGDELFMIDVIVEKLPDEKAESVEDTTTPEDSDTIEQRQLEKRKAMVEKLRNCIKSGS